MGHSYINIRQILDNILRHPLMEGVSFEQAVSYAADFISIVGMPEMFEEKVTDLEIHDYRALLPCNFDEIIQVKCADGTFRYSTDSFHMEHIEDKYDLTYKIQGNIIYTSIKEGKITIAYRAIGLDSEGYPLLPDNSNFTRALELYIKKQWFTVLFDLGKITQASLQNVQQEYAWAVGSCQTEFNRLSLDKMESVINSLNTLIPRRNEHEYGYRHNGMKERLIIS